MTGAPWSHIEKDLPSAAQIISPSVHEPEPAGPFALAEEVGMADAVDEAPKEDATL